MNKPAFPTPESAEFQPGDGMTLREYFAAHAPANVPTWFQHQPPAKTHGDPPMPKVPEPPRDQAEGETYTDFTSRRAEMVEVYNAAFQALKPTRAMWVLQEAAWVRRDCMARLVQWRWAYAEAMVAASEKTCNLCGKPNAEPGSNHNDCEFEANHGDDIRREAAE